MAEQSQHMDRDSEMAEYVAIVVAAILSAGAAVIHLLATPAHFDEWWGMECSS